MVRLKNALTKQLTGENEHFDLQLREKEEESVRCASLVRTPVFSSKACSTSSLRCRRLLKELTTTITSCKGTESRPNVNTRFYNADTKAKRRKPISTEARAQGTRKA